MSFINWLILHEQGEDHDEEIEEEGYCPNCWGTQHYDTQFLEALADKQIVINNKDPQNRKSFIQEFVITNLEPIKLHNYEVYDQCPSCKRKYNKQ